MQQTMTWPSNEPMQQYGDPILCRACGLTLGYSRGYELAFDMNGNATVRQKIVLVCRCNYHRTWRPARG